MCKHTTCISWFGVKISIHTWNQKLVVTWPFWVLCCLAFFSRFEGFSFTSVLARQIPVLPGLGLLVDWLPGSLTNTVKMPALPSLNISTAAYDAIWGALGCELLSISSFTLANGRLTRRWKSAYCCWNKNKMYMELCPYMVIIQLLPYWPHPCTKLMSIVAWAINLRNAWAIDLRNTSHLT